VILWDPSPPLIAGEADLECWVQLWASQYKQDVYILECVWKRAMKVTKEQEHLPYEESLRELRLFIQPGEEKAQGELSNAFTYLMGGSKEQGARLFSVVSSSRARGNGHELKHRSCAPTWTRSSTAYCR